MTRVMFLFDGVAGLFNQILNWVAMAVMYIWFMFQSIIAQVLDLLTQLFFIFAGMTPVNDTTKFDKVTGKPSEVDIVNFFLTKETFRNAYIDLCLVALGLVIVFTIAKIIKQDYFEKAGPRSKGPIFRNVALSFIAFLCVMPIFYFIIGASGSLALLVMNALGYEGGGLGTMLFNLSWSDLGKSFISLGETMPKSSMRDDNYFGWYDPNTFYEYFWNESETNFREMGTGYRQAIYYWWIFVVTGLVLIANLFKMLLAMISRLFKLIALFIVAPSPISQIVLDDGAKFKDWKNKVIQEAVKVVGCMMSFMIFLLVARAVNDLDLARFAFSPKAASATAKNLIDSNMVANELSGEINALYYGNAATPGWVDNVINALAKACLLIAGVGAIQDMDKMITPLLAGGTSSMDIGETGKGLTNSMSAIANGALDVTKGTVGVAVGGVSALAKIPGKIAGGLSDWGSGIATAVNNHTGKKLDKEAKEDRDREAVAAPTEGDGGPGADTGDEAVTPGDGGPGADTGDEAVTPGGSGGSEGPGSGDGDEAAEEAEETASPTAGGGGSDGEPTLAEEIAAGGPISGVGRAMKGLGEKVAESKVGKAAKEGISKLKNDPELKWAGGVLRKAGKGVGMAGKIAGGVVKHGIVPLAHVGEKLVTTGVKAGWKVAGVAGTATSALLKATGLGGVANIGEKAASTVASVPKTIAAGYKDVKNSYKETKKKIEGNRKKVADQKEALKNKAEEIVANKPKPKSGSGGGGESAASPEGVARSVSDSAREAESVGEFARLTGDGSDEALDLRMDGYEEALSLDEAHSAAEESYMAARDEVDVAEADAKSAQQEADKFKADKAFSSKSGKEFLAAAEGYRTAKDGSDEQSKYKEQLEEMKSNKKYEKAATAYYGKTKDGKDINWYGAGQRENSDNLYSKNVALSEATAKKTEAAGKLNDTTKAEEKTRKARDEYLRGSTTAVKAKIAGRNLERMTKTLGGAKAGTARAKYAQEQVKVLKKSAGDLGGKLAAKTKTVAARNEQFAQSYGYESAAKMMEQDNYAASMKAQVESAENIKTAYDEAQAIGNTSPLVSELDSSGYDEIKTTQADYMSAKEAREKAQEAVDKLSSTATDGERTAANDKLAQCKDKETEAKRKYDDANGKDKTAATKYRIAVDNYNAKYQEYQDAVSGGDADRIKEAHEAYHGARKEMNSCRNDVNEVVVKVSFKSKTMGGGARQKAPAASPVSPVTPTTSSGGPFRSDVGASIMRAVKRRSVKDVNDRLNTSYNRQEIDNNTYNFSKTLYTGDVGGPELRNLDMNLPDTYGLEVEQVIDMIDGVSKLPFDKAYYRKNGIATREAYTADVVGRYKKAKDDYESAMKEVKENFATYKGTQDVSALNLAKEAMAKVISCCANMKNITKEIHGKK